MKRLLPLCALLVLSSAVAWADWGEKKKERKSGWGAPPPPSKSETRGWGSGGKTEAKNQNAKIYVLYATAKGEFAQGMEQGLKASGGFETLATALDGIFKMPRDLPIVIGTCGAINLFYDPENHRIIICYEFMEHLVELAQSQGLKFKTDEALGQWIGQVTVFGLFHEFGHALIGELELPSTGKEEDAVDEFAAIALSKIGDTGHMAAMSGAHWFQLEDREKTKRGVSSAFWDEHSFDLQRMANIVCLMLGHSQAKYKDVADSLEFSAQRQQRCVNDYPRKDKAWQTLLGPHMKR